MIIDWINDNWATIIPIIISLIAILFTGLKDFILPWFFKPKLEINYLPKEPYKKGPVTGYQSNEIERINANFFGDKK